MSEQQATTPTDVAQPSIDDKIAAKFGITVEPVEEAPEAPQEATPEEAEGDEPVVETEEVPPEPDGFEDLIHKGETKRVSKEEMRNLAQKGFDYEVNMVQNKAERQRLQSLATAIEAQQALGAQVIDQIADLKSLDKQISAYANVDWIRLANEDPQSALRYKIAHDQLLQTRHQALSTLQQTADQQSAAQVQISQDQLTFEHSELLKRVPEWRDEAKASAEKRAIFEDLGKQFAPDELKTWAKFLHDHRVVGMLRDGFKYRQAVEAGKAKKGQLQGLPQAAKPSARQPAPTKTQNVKEAKTDLHRAKSPESRKAAEDRMLAAKFGIKL